MDASLASPPKLLDRMRSERRLRHMDLRTEVAWVAWSRRFILFHARPHPKELELLGPKEVETTMICTHVLNPGGRGVLSPLDRL
jgi:hypothetical protein